MRVTRPIFLGITQQFSCDDKGTSIFFAFGLPTCFTHEFDCDFAVKAALKLRSALLKLGSHPFSIALSCGTTFIGTVGNKIRCDTAIVGDPVVVAVRLLQLDAAENSIVCDWSVCNRATRSATLSILVTTR